MPLDTRMESLPQVIKEAYYLKVPVIATNVGGIPEIVEDLSSDPSTCTG